MKVAVLFLFALSFQQTRAQDQYTGFTTTLQKLVAAPGEEALDRMWNDLVSTHKIPIVVEDSVAFLYRGDARKVVWTGDFNGWGSLQNFNSTGTRIRGTNLWILKLSLPKDARLDYKIILNDQTYILDPVNVFGQWSGVGGGSQNSELRMPAWKEDPLTVSRLEGAAAGKIEKDLFYNSPTLGYHLTYSVYLPHTYHANEPLPVVYVTDGYEYMHERLGNMITILDNLIYLRKIKPVMAVFIDNRNPVNRSETRRMQELAMSEKYLAFITNELIPLIEKKYTVSNSASERAIIGTSLGGLYAAYAAFTKPDVFGQAGIQSPAFWFKPQIYTLAETSRVPVKTFISTGAIHDAREGAQKMKDILENKNANIRYTEVNQGHSWGNFRDLIDDMLVYFYPAD
jgi:enterochelin esterase family protein